jgi:hypothetical protein
MITKLIVALALTQTTDAITISCEQTFPMSVNSYVPVGSTDGQLKELRDKLGQSYYLLIGTWKLPLMKNYVSM